MAEANETKKTVSQKDKVISIIGIVICVILAFVLIANVTMLIKSAVKKDEVPSFLSFSPMVVLTDSMNPYIKAGDLIFVSTVNPAKVEVGDVLAFFDPAGNGTSVETHRVIEVIENGDGTRSFRTKGDNNNVEDRLSVPEKSLVGKYRFRLAGMGHVFLFLNTTPGLIVSVGVPLLILLGFEFLQRRKRDQRKQADTDALLAELEALKKAKAEAEGNPPRDDEGQP